VWRKKGLLIEPEGEIAALAKSSSDIADTEAKGGIWGAIGNRASVEPNCFAVPASATSQKVSHAGCFWFDLI
jgi:hypothetical protein